MKKFLLICSLAFIAFLSNAQSVSINTDGSTAAPSAMLDVKSTTKGLLIPRMTTTQRSAIPMPAVGLMVFDTDLSNFYFYNGTEWKSLSSGGASFTLPYSQFLNTSSILFEINNQGTGSAIAATSIEGTAINAFSANSMALSAQSVNSQGLLARSDKSSAIKAYIDYDDIDNLNPTINTENFGGGAGLRASSLNNYGIYATASSSTKAAIVAEHPGSGLGIIAKSAAGHALVVDGKLAIKGGNTNPSNGAVLTSDATGNAVWKANKIAFRATSINTNFTALPGDGLRKKMHFSTQTYDYGDGFVPSTSAAPAESEGAFTAPVNGIYHFDVKTSIGLSLQQRFSGQIRMIVKRGVSTLVIGGTFGESDPSGSLPLSFSADYELEQGDIVIVEVASFPSSTSTSALISSLNSLFSGHLVFAN